LWPLLLAVALAACATQRPYSPPGPLPDSTTFHDSALIPYRTLVVDDFKAPVFLGKKSPDMEGDVGAATVVIIDTTPHHFRVFPQSNADSSWFEAFVDTFRYEARFDQAHSWFNRSFMADAAQLLAHEQIHFAIAELAARSANAQLPEIRERIRSRHREREVALRTARERFLEELKRVKKDAARRQDEFDRETENGTHVGESSYWSRRIHHELESTAPPQL
jgi:hypothetical protein